MDTHVYVTLVIQVSTTLT